MYPPAGSFRYQVSSQPVRSSTLCSSEDFFCCLSVCSGPVLCKLRYLKCCFVLILTLVVMYFVYTIGARGDIHSRFLVNRTLIRHSPADNVSNTLHVLYPSATPEEDSVSNQVCPPVPPHLEGRVAIVLEAVRSIEQQEEQRGRLGDGGSFKTDGCVSRYNVAIIAPYRSRKEHLKVFLNHLHPFLQRQQIDYTIFVVEQSGKNRFNRASLLNVGYLEALKLQNFDCFIFHDIDLLPEDDRNLYTCPKQPRHMSVAISTMKYKLPYNDIFGGVSALTTAQFRKVNGFSNKFWGWGAEDDDMSNRLKFHGFYISRYPVNVARYTMMTHQKDKPNPHRYKVLNDGRKNFAKDGLSSVKYKVLQIEFKKLFTWIHVKILKS